MRRHPTTNKAEIPDDVPMFARSVGPHGKLDDEGKYKIDSATMLAFRRYCVDLGSDPSSEVRNHIYEVIYGKSYDEMVLAEQQHAAAKRKGVLGALRGLIGGPDVASKSNSKP